MPRILPYVRSGSKNLTGVKASPGIGEGRVVKILSVRDFSKMRDGDILVTQTTNPAWTPLFLRASGVVTDIGGALSHAAIVARELHIPAVLGTGNATHVLNDGDVVVVDGTSGIVSKIGPE